MDSDLLQMVAGKPITRSVIVDAACDQSTGICAYQGKFLDTGQMIFKMGPFAGGTNNIVEFLAVVHALAHLKKLGIDIPVYTDSQTAISWIKVGRINTKQSRTKDNKPLFDLVDRAHKWLNENTGYTVLKWNSRAWGENPADYGFKR